MTFLKQIKITCFIEFVSLYSCPDIYNKINKCLVRFFDLNINLQDNLKNISACLPILKTVRWSTSNRHNFNAGPR